MDYTNFVRTYYRIAMQKLGQYEKYNGSVVDFYDVLNIPSDKKHEVQRKSMFLPNFDININADANYFIDFMDYYGKIYVNLGGILLDKSKLVKLFDMFRIGADDETITDGISLYVDAGLKFLAETGVIA